MTITKNYRGKIIKGIAGFYYVHVDSMGIYACKAKGIFRKRGEKPLVGDDVVMEITDEKDMEGNIIELLPRKSSIIRPSAANVDQAVIIFAAAQPAPNLGLLDRFLLIMQKQDLDTVICFNKEDLAEEGYINKLKDIYKGSGCTVLSSSVKNGHGIEELRSIMEGKTSVMAGPSGVGKSSLTNALFPDAQMATGEISRKVKRGRHTTRHSEIFAIGGSTYLIDTPGFSTLYIDDFDKDELKYYFPEFDDYINSCRYNGCNHINEPDCAVKDAVRDGIISSVRYDSYKEMHGYLSGLRKY